ncbi:hypothetical protein INS90_06955 [Trueperella pecoris]|uniref:N-acetyltransferase domain-containing protein n=1 Tax=Trueperella pecoris TaxID=2733571 RepID=A0A7M1QYR8_9ACTO|nr:hypothetical protein [Trueperella pecoris]QOR47016.1 hypothetical protein INS90_06955 [Trueperella pecoris]
MNHDGLAESQETASLKRLPNSDVSQRSGDKATATPADAPAVNFLLAHGYGLDMAEKISMLDLRANAPRFAAILEHYCRAAGLDVDVEANGTADVGWEEMARIRNEFNADVPSSDGWRPAAETAESVSERFRIEQGRGITRYGILIRHRASGDAVAYTEVTAMRGARVAQQNLTWVDRRYRGRKLSGLAKAANAIRLVTEGNIDAVETWNAEGDRAMWAVNDRLGFALTNVEGEWFSVYRDERWQPQA